MHHFDIPALRYRRIPRPLNAIPLMLVVAVPVIDLVVPPSIHLASMLFVAPALTAAFASCRRTAWVGTAAVAALVVAGLERRALTTENVIVQTICLIALSALVVLFCHLREWYERDLVRVRRISEETQRVLLRPLPQRVGSVTIAAEYQAAEKDARIGGDLYAVAHTGRSTRLIIGDVRGKGLTSISDAAFLLEAFREAARRRSSLPEMIESLEGAFQQGGADFPTTQVDAAERFATAVVADIPDDEPLVHLVSLGHPMPLLLRDGSATALDVPQPLPPFGLAPLSDGPAMAVTFPFDRGDLLLFYTDGLIEARNTERMFYPLAQRVTMWTGSSPSDLLEHVVADVRRHTADTADTAGDDMAVVALRRD